MSKTFPTLQARNLLGQSYTLPDDFEGARNVVLVAFQRWHQFLVDEWVAGLAPLRERYPNLHIYEIPVMSNFYLLARPFIDGGMAMAIGSAEVRKHTLTVYTDVWQVRDELDLPDTRTISVFLVVQGGQIIWRAHGAFAPEQVEELEKVLLGNSGTKVE